MLKTTALAGTLATVLAAGAQAGTLTLYTSVPTEIMNDIETAFEAAHPEVDLEVFRSGTGNITAKIATEQEAGGVEADVIWVADFAYYETLKEDDLLMRYVPEAARAIPDTMKDPEGYYTGARMIAMVMAYNTTLVEEAPQAWEDLLDAKWEDQIVMPNPIYSGAALVTTGALVMEKGLSFYEDLRANGATVVRGNSGAARSIGAGEYPVGMTLDYIVRGLKEQGSTIDLVYPEEGSVAIPSPIGIIAGTDNEADAKTFVDFAVSEEGQTALRELGSFIPVRPEMESPAGAPSLSEVADTAMETDWAFIRANTDWLRDRFTTIMLD